MCEHEKDEFKLGETKEFTPLLDARELGFISETLPPAPALELNDLPTQCPAPLAGKERVDVWLWAVRKYKTRSMAASACKGGHVRVNSHPAKAATSVRRGDVVSVRKDGFTYYFQVVALPPKRLGAPLAAECYVDLSAPKPARRFLPALPQREKGTGRPTKKQRRELDQLRARDTNRERH